MFANRVSFARRCFLRSAALTLSAMTLGKLAWAQSAPTQQSIEPFSEILRKLAATHSLSLQRDGDGFTGAGWNWLVSQARAAHFAAVGEEHGLADIPRATAALYTAAHFDRLSVEISPPTAARIDHVLREHDLSHFTQRFAGPPLAVAFYSNREDAELLAHVRQSSATPQQLIWGTDYEIANDRPLLRELVAHAPQGSPREQAQRILTISEAMWARAMETKNPALIWSFCGDPTLFDDLRAAWPHPDADSAAIISTLQTTLAINKLWLAGENFRSNEMRSMNMRTQFLNYWRAERAAGHKPRVLLRYGDEHVVRGATPMGSFDLGALICDLAQIESGTSFNVLMIAGQQSTRASLDPTVLRYRNIPAKVSEYPELAPFVEDTGGAINIYDLRSMRPTINGAGKAVSTNLLRTILGYDALLVFGSAKPATPLA